MFGTLRYILACMVALSHIGVTVFDQNIGVIAVVCFYILSGYVMTSLIDTRFRGYKSFYIKRIVRIYPQYLFFLLLATLLWIYGAKSSFLSAAPTFLMWLQNILIVPLNFSMYSGINSFTLIPPAWSLGAELQFYLLAPFILRLKPIVQYIIVAITLFIFSLAQIGILNTDYFGYRLLPGVFFIFFIGSLLYRSRHDKTSAYLLLLLWAVFFCYSIFLYFTSHHIPFNMEVAIGVSLSIPVVYPLSLLKRKNIDEFFGYLSYGVFLSHFVVIFIYSLFRQTPVSPYELLFFSTLLAYISHRYIELWVWSKIKN